MIADFHLHSSYSGDSTTSMTGMIEQAISLGLPVMCFTDHYDMDYPQDSSHWIFNIDDYFENLLRLREKYNDSIEILTGIELGLQPQLGEKCSELIHRYPFDFVIGSSHVVNGTDPYFPEYYENRTEEEAYIAYFESIIDNIHTFNKINVYGHLDYVIRYGPNKNKYYSYEKYRDIIDRILMLCIEKGIGLELNTAGIRYGLGQPHPHPDILKRYRSLGGEILTIGSDAHEPAHLAYAFKDVPAILRECGFSYYTIFRKQKPEFIKL